MSIFKAKGEKRPLRGAKSVKRIISSILSVALCAAMLPAAFAANEDLVFRDARSDFAAEFADSKIVDAQALGEDKIAALTDDGDLWLHSDEFGTFKATPQNTQKERPCGKIPPGRAYIRHSISAAAALI